jgi:4-methyl-5(b-hydroxyethyl)-thiazole monophosphate biosynthesis
MSKRVLCLLAPGFEEIEAVTPIDLLRRAGAEVVVASLNGETLVTGRSKLALQADAALVDVADKDFDLLLLPGGPGVRLFAQTAGQRSSREILRCGKICRSCAAPAVLKDADLLGNRNFGAFFHLRRGARCPGAERVVRDGKISPPAGGTAVDFGLALVRALFGDAEAEEIARAIMA